MQAKYLSMVFKVESGDKVSINVYGIKEDLTKEEVSAAMDIIIAKNAFITKGGRLIEKSEAKFISKNVDQYDLA